MNENKRPTWTGVDTQQASKAAIAFVLIFTFVFVIFLLLIRPPANLDPDIKAILMTMLGWLAGKVSTIVDYNYGSSEGSNQSGQFIRQSQDKMLTSLTVNPAASISAATTAAALAAPAAAAAAAPPAAAVAAPPAAEEAAPAAAAAAAPAAAEKALRDELHSDASKIP